VLHRACWLCIRNKLQELVEKVAVGFSEGRCMLCCALVASWRN
jgi:hypothetical protein